MCVPLNMHSSSGRRGRISRGRATTIDDYCRRRNGNYSRDDAVLRPYSSVTATFRTNQRHQNESVLSSMSLFSPPLSPSLSP